MSPRRRSICAIAGFFVLGIVLGPVAVVCGRLAMGRAWTGTRPTPALVALVLGAIDSLLAVIMPAGATPGTGMFQPGEREGRAPGGTSGGPPSCRVEVTV